MNHDPTRPDVGRYEVVVRDVETPDLGVRTVEFPTPSIKSRGNGELKTAAFERIRERLDLGENVGEHVATVTIDVSAWDYNIRWRVERPLGLRLVDAFAELLDDLAGGAADA